MHRSAVVLALSALLGSADVYSQSAPPIPPPPADSVTTQSNGSADVFAQTPRDQADLSRAAEAFAAKRYSQAASLYAEATKAKEILTPAQRDQWAYCRLHTAATKLNAGIGQSDLAAVAKEIEDAARICSDKVEPFAAQLREEIRKRNPPTKLSDAGWQVVEGTNFRVHHQNQLRLAADVGRTAEEARRAMYERWHGPAPESWTPMMF